MKQLALIVFLSAVVFGAFFSVASSENPDSLEVKVTPLLVLAVRIPDADSLVNFNTLDLSGNNIERTTAASGTLNVYNDGSTPVRLLIQGSNAETEEEGHEDWVLDCSNDSTGEVDTDKYVLRYSMDLNVDWASSAPKTMCPGSGKELTSGVAANGGQVQFLLQMNMPTGTTGYSQRTTTVTLTAMQ